MKLSIKEKLGYSLGDTASHFVWDLVGFWLLIFYTDIYGLSPAMAGVIMFVGSIWDAVMDPVVGIISDRTNSRWGKFRPYLLFGSVPYAILAVMAFTTPDFGDTGKAALYRAAPPMMKTSSREPFSTSCAQMPNASSNEAHTSQPGRELSVVLTTMLRRPGNAPWGSDSKVCLPMIMACPQVVSLKWARSSGRCQGSVPSMPIARLRAMATMMLTMGYESFLFSILADRCCWPVGQCFSRSPTVVGGK